MKAEGKGCIAIGHITFCLYKQGTFFLLNKAPFRGPTTRLNPNPLLHHQAASAAKETNLAVIHPAIELVKEKQQIRDNQSQQIQTYFFLGITIPTQDPA